MTRHSFGSTAGVSVYQLIRLMALVGLVGSLFAVATPASLPDGGWLCAVWGEGYSSGLKTALRCDFHIGFGLAERRASAILTRFDRAAVGAPVWVFLVTKQDLKSVVSVR